MKIGIARSKGTEGLLKVAIAIALGYALIRAGEFVYSRVPPLKEGVCYQTGNPFVALRVNKNHIVEGYSDVTLQLLIVQEELKASFLELRELTVTEIKCD